MRRVVVVRCPRCGSTDAASDETRSLVDISFMVCGACGLEEPQDPYQLGDRWNVELELPDDRATLPGNVPSAPRRGPRALVRRGRLAWWDEAIAGRPERRAFFRHDGAWIDAVGVDAVRRLVERLVPGLDVAADAGDLIHAFTRLTATEALVDRSDVDDLCDPRWHAVPLARAEVARWEPPRVEGHRLTFFVHHRRALEVVRLDGDSGEVRVEPARPDPPRRDEA